MNNWEGPWCEHGKSLRESCDGCETAALLYWKRRWKENLSQMCQRVAQGIEIEIGIEKAERRGIF